ncbi:MAG: hypothetical protein WB801_11395 [Candidatus Dormiibacterota bacterium]
MSLRSPSNDLLTDSSLRAERGAQWGEVVAELLEAQLTARGPWKM